MTKTGSGEMVSVQSDAMLRYGAAALALVSQLIHLWVLQEEFLFRPLSGGLMFLAAVSQGFVAAGLLFGAGRWTAWLGILLNAGLISAWVSTRFFGAPTLLGFESLPVGPLSVVAVVAEAMIIVLLVSIRRRPEAPRG